MALVAARAEGNPFVLEEMLREALDRGDVLRTEAGWERRSGDTLRMPETVREAVLLRLGRLDAEHIEVLRAAAVLGRSFDYGLLVEVAQADEGVVLAALEAAVAQQLLEEAAGAGGRYTWRHALTQEAIAGDTVVPKRQAIHSRAADALLRSGGGATARAGHLLGAGRTQEAVGACLDAAAEAERAVGFTEAAALLERVLPHVRDARERALLLARMGHLRWQNGEPAAADQLLVDGVRQLDDLGLTLEAARARLHLGRCRWELDQPDAALRDFEHARDVFEGEGPSSELALAYLRIAGIHAFQLDYTRCGVAAERAALIAEQAGADFERIWAQSFAALAFLGTAREFDVLDRCYAEALAQGYTRIATNALYNEVWDRVHTLAGGLGEALAKAAVLPEGPWNASGGSIALGIALLALGDPRAALEHARAAIARYEGMGAVKYVWRSRLAAADALLELGHAAQAMAELPPPSPGNELQDIVYDTEPRIGIALALGDVEAAVALARRVADAEPVLVFRGTVAVAVEALVAGGHAAEAEALVRRSEHARADLGDTGLDLSRGRILLAAGHAADARPHLERARRAFAERGLPIWAGRAAALAAEAAARAGDMDAAGALYAECIGAAHLAGARRLRDDAAAGAAALGIDVPSFADAVDAEGPQAAGRSGRALRDVALCRRARVHAGRRGQLAPRSSPIASRRCIAGPPPRSGAGAGSSTSSPATP